MFALRLLSHCVVQVLIPGDPEREAEAVRSVRGIPVKLAVIRDMMDITSRTGIKFEY